MKETEEMGTCYECKKELPIGRGQNFEHHPDKEGEYLCNECMKKYD